MNNKIYDVVVIGCGASGATASIYASRSGMKVGLIEKGLYGGVLHETPLVENYTGEIQISGEDLAEKMENHVRVQENIEHIYGEVVSIEKKDSFFEVALKDFIIDTKSVVIATGVKYKKINVTGEDKFEGRGISNCALCDGMFFKDKHVAVIGGGDSAVESVEYLSNIVEKVTLVHRRSELKAEKILQDRISGKDNIEFIWDANVELFSGEKNNLDTIGYYKNGELNFLSVDGAFVNIGIEPNTDNFTNLEILDEEGFILTNSSMETHLEGLFAIGDVRSHSIRQVVNATADGAIVSKTVSEYLKTRGDSIG